MLMKKFTLFCILFFCLLGTAMAKDEAKDFNSPEVYPSNDKLETIDASNNLLSSIILSNQPALKFINVDENAEITLIDVSNSPDIESINALKTNLSTLIVKDKNAIVVKETTVVKKYKDGT